MSTILFRPQWLNTLRPRQNGLHFPDDIFKYIFLFENAWIWIKISPRVVPKVRINNIPALVQIMAWRRIGDKPLSEPMMVNLLTHICVTMPQWVDSDFLIQSVQGAHSTLPARLLWFGRRGTWTSKSWLSWSQSSSRSVEKNMERSPAFGLSWEKKDTLMCFIKIGQRIWGSEGERASQSVFPRLMKGF